MAVDAFGIEKEFLRDLLREVSDGHAQLPEFQRGWVWPDRNIASLLASISMGYPAGTLMMLRTGGDVRFKLRPVEGATPPPGVRPERLILDGQQRLTSLFQALTAGRPVQTQDVRKHPISGWFYIDMRLALDANGDREEAIRFLAADRVQRNFRGETVEDYSTPEREYAAHMFPLHKVFDPDDWSMGFQEHWDYDRDQIRLWNSFRTEVVRRFDTYQLPVIELGRDTPRQAVCQVFEKVNTGGVTLTVFELLTATYAADEFDLRRHWEEQCRAAWSAPEYRILREVSNTDFLQAVTLLATSARRDAAAARGEEDERLPRIGCKRADMLGLTLAEYQRFAPAIVGGMKAAAKFLHRQYLFDTKFLPYGTQLIPLAAILAVLDKDGQSAGAQQKLARWYWCGVFGELYGGTTETRFSRDLPERRRLDPKIRLATPHHNRSPVRRWPSPDLADTWQRGLQGHLRPADEGRGARLAYRRGSDRHHLLRGGNRHPPHLPEGLVRNAKDPTSRVQLHREQDSAHGAHQPGDRRPGTI